MLFSLASSTKLGIVTPSDELLSLCRFDSEVPEHNCCDEMSVADRLSESRSGFTVERSLNGQERSVGAVGRRL